MTHIRGVSMAVVTPQTVLPDSGQTVLSKAATPKVFTALSQTGLRMARQHMASSMQDFPAQRLINMAVQPED